MFFWHSSITKDKHVREYGQMKPTSISTKIALKRIMQNIHPTLWYFDIGIELGEIGRFVFWGSSSP